MSTLNHMKPLGPRSVFDAHPAPWRCGESNESMARVIDANRNEVCVIRAQYMSGCPGEQAEILVDAANAKSTRHIPVQ